MVDSYAEIFPVETWKLSLTGNALLDYGRSFFSPAIRARLVEISDLIHIRRVYPTIISLPFPSGALSTSQTNQHPATMSKSQIGNATYSFNSTRIFPETRGGLSGILIRKLVSFN